MRTRSHDLSSRAFNAANRLLFSVSRGLGDGHRDHNLLVRTSTRYRSPIGALLDTGSVSLAALFAFSFEKTAVRALIFIVQYGAYLILGVHLLTVIAAIVVVGRHGRRPVPLWVFGLGVPAVLYVRRDTFIPLPAGPFGVVALAAMGSTILRSASR